MDFIKNLACLLFFALYKMKTTHAMNTLVQWAKENYFKINKDKTIQMVFRRGGGISTKDNIKIGEEPLKIVNKFKYLGLTIQATLRNKRGI